MLQFNYSKTSDITPNMIKEQANKKEENWYVQQPTKWEEQNIRTLLTSTSISPNVFSDGHRTNKSYERTVHIMIDFDEAQPPQGNGLTFQEVISIVSLYFKNTACAMFASNSNKKPYNKNNFDYQPHEKFRLVFPLPTNIYNNDLKDLKTFFSSKFSNKIDQSSFDKYRYFYKGNDSLWYFQDGNYIDIQKCLSEGKALSSLKPQIDYLYPSTKITLINNTETVLQNILTDEICFCPFHPDKEASAKIFINKGGIRILHCSSCKSRGLGTDGKGNFYAKNYNTVEEDIIENKVTVFYSTKHQNPVLYNKQNTINPTSPDNDISKNMFTPIRLGGVGWEIFCNNYNYQPDLLKFIPMADITYNPNEPNGLNLQDKVFNYFEPSPYMNTYETKITPNLNTLQNKTPFIYKILQNVIGDEKAITYYLNWFAFLLQEKPKSIKTCILLMDEVRGIGKDILFELVWQPIFGNNAIQQDSSKLGNKFNTKLANIMLARYNEVFTKGNKDLNLDKINWIKNFVGSAKKEIEPKGIDSYDVDNFTGVILHTNYYDNGIMDLSDRRVSVFENKNAKKITELFPDVKNLDSFIKSSILNELPQFAEYVQSIETIERDTSIPFESHVRTVMQHISRDILKEFAEVLKSDKMTDEEKIDFFDIENAILQHPTVVKYTKLDFMGKKYEPKLPTQDEIIETVNYFITKKSIPALYINALLLHKGIKALETAKNQLMLYNITQYKDLTTKKRFKSEYTTKSPQRFKKEYYLFRA